MRRLGGGASAPRSSRWANMWGHFLRALCAPDPFVFISGESLRVIDTLFFFAAVLVLLLRLLYELWRA